MKKNLYDTGCCIDVNPPCFSSESPKQSKYFRYYRAFMITVITVIGITLNCNAQWQYSGGNAYLYNTGNPTFAIIGSSSGVKTTYGFLGTSQDTSGYFDFHAFKTVSPSVFGNIILNLNGGQVGIGTATIGTVKINNTNTHTFRPTEARLVVSNNSDSTYSDALVIKGGTSLPNTHSQGILFADVNSMQAAIRAKRLNVTGNYQSDLQFYTGDGISQFQNEANVRMTITHDGLVGIGTRIPDQALTVNGTVHSTVVRVTATVPGPDYVFNNDYKLITLPDLKNYLSKNHHLPEIPSAAEMAKDGLDLGDMNTKLLKKVEELTLYLIDKDKQLANLESTVSKLKKQVTAINKGMKKRQHTKSL